MIELTRKEYEDIFNHINDLHHYFIESNRNKLNELIEKNNILKNSFTSNIWYKNTYYRGFFEEIRRAKPEELHINLHKQMDIYVTFNKKMVSDFKRIFGFLSSIRSKIKCRTSFNILLPKFLQLFELQKVNELTPKNILKEYPALIKEHYFFIEKCDFYHALQIINN